jgi:hypothetical protein
MQPKGLALTRFLVATVPCEAMRSGERSGRMRTASVVRVRHAADTSHTMQRSAAAAETALQRLVCRAALSQHAAVSRPVAYTLDWA